MTTQFEKRIVDLRSDIVGSLSLAMQSALIASVKSYRSYEMRESEEERLLEGAVAHVLGMEDSLFFPTCTMANQAALRLHCPSGSFVLADRFAHICTNEAASTAALSGVAVIGLDGKEGHPTQEELKEALDSLDDQIRDSVSLVWAENTHNVAGGTVMPPPRFESVVRFAKDRGIKLHVDGARIWNAAASAQCEPADLVRNADSVSVSLNKGIGAPQGAVLAGSKELIARAVRLRTLLGGGWRPWPGLASAGLAAVESWDRVDLDNRRAQVLGRELAKLTWLVPVIEAQTNIVVVRPIALSPLEVAGKLKEQGVLVGPHPGGAIRMVTHQDIDDMGIANAIRAFRAIAV
jgi:threonine aldolase